MTDAKPCACATDMKGNNHCPLHGFCDCYPSLWGGIETKDCPLHKEKPVNPNAECTGGHCKFCSTLCRKDKPHKPCCGHRADRAADCQICSDKGIIVFPDGGVVYCHCCEQGEEMKEFF